MTKIDTITGAARQHFTILLDDNSKVNFTLEFRANQMGWFYSAIYKNWAHYNRRLVTSLNMLRAFKNILPFGIAVITNDGLEPVFIDDFTNGRASLYLLNAADVVSVEAQILTYA